MRKRRHGEVQSLAQDDTVGKWAMGFEPRLSGSRMHAMCLGEQQAELWEQVAPCRLAAPLPLPPLLAAGGIAPGLAAPSPQGFRFPPHPCAWLPSVGSQGWQRCRAPCEGPPSLSLSLVPSWEGLGCTLTAPHRPPAGWRSCACADISLVVHVTGPSACAVLQMCWRDESTRNSDWRASSEKLLTSSSHRQSRRRGRKQREEGK